MYTNKEAKPQCGMKLLHFKFSTIIFVILISMIQIYSAMIILGEWPSMSERLSIDLYKIGLTLCEEERLGDESTFLLGFLMKILIIFLRKIIQFQINIISLLYNFNNNINNIQIVFPFKILIKHPRMIFHKIFVDLINFYKKTNK